MTPDAIAQLRAVLHETRAQFGDRFCRSPRTVEAWEQGRRTPEPLALRELERLHHLSAKRAGRA